MKYEPIKEKIGSVIGTNHLLRRLYYFALGIILLRAWHVKREIRKIFEAHICGDVLDAGCGPGQYSYYIAKKYGAKVLGVDVIRSEVDRCNRFAHEQDLANMEFTAADLSSDNFAKAFSEKFDLIVSVDVMEHIKDDAAVFQNFASVLRRGGRVVISTPAAGADHEDEQEHSFIDEHFRPGYSPQDISDKLAQANLKVEKLAFTYGFGGSIYWRLTMKIPVTLLNKSMMFFILLPFYYAVAFPISLIFMGVDYFLQPKSGGGLLVVARKS
jgi:SAM-dependent methyltransferase